MVRKQVELGIDQRVLCLYPFTPTKSMQMSILRSPSSSAKHIFRN